MFDVVLRLATIRDHTAFSFLAFLENLNFASGVKVVFGCCCCFAPSYMQQLDFVTMFHLTD